MEFLDFLKYGAIGIALAFAILAFRLLSKEQERETVRPEMLKSIKTYLIITVCLAIFFGIFEIFDKKITSTNEFGPEIDHIWHQHFSDKADSTLVQKLATISNALNRPDNSGKVIDTISVCDLFINDFNDCSTKLLVYENGFFQNLIKLRSAVNKDPDGWLNLKFNKTTKTEVYHTLQKLYSSLGYDASVLQTDDQIITFWESLKKKWPVEQPEHVYYVFDSDIINLTRLYIAKYGNS